MSSFFCSVTGIPSNVSDADISERFGRYGEVINVRSLGDDRKVCRIGFSNQEKRDFCVKIYGGTKWRGAKLYVSPFDVMPTSHADSGEPLKPYKASVAEDATAKSTRGDMGEVLMSYKASRKKTFDDEADAVVLEPSEKNFVASKAQRKISSESKPATGSLEGQIFSATKDGDKNSFKKVPKESVRSSDSALRPGKLGQKSLDPLKTKKRREGSVKEGTRYANSKSKMVAITSVAAGVKENVKPLEDWMGSDVSDEELEPNLFDEREEESKSEVPLGKMPIGTAFGGDDRFKLTEMFAVGEGENKGSQSEVESENSDSGSSATSESLVDSGIGVATVDDAQFSAEMRQGKVIAMSVLKKLCPEENVGLSILEDHKAKTERRQRRADRDSFKPMEMFDPTSEAAQRDIRADSNSESEGEMEADKPRKAAERPAPPIKTDFNFQVTSSWADLVSGPGEVLSSQEKVNQVDIQQSDVNLKPVDGEHSGKAEDEKQNKRDTRGNGDERSRLKGRLAKADNERPKKRKRK